MTDFYGTSYKKNMRILIDMWKKTGEPMICPQCGGSMTIVQIEPVQDIENAYVPYRTVVECNSCSFKVEAESFTILGSIKDFDAEHVEIGSWSPSGSRVLSKYKHILSYDLLKELKKTGELVEFLIVDKQDVQVIG